MTAQRPDAAYVDRQMASAACSSYVAGVNSGQEAKRPGDATNVPGRDTEEVTSMPDKRTAHVRRSPLQEMLAAQTERDQKQTWCDYCDTFATHKVTWTVYGGGLKTKRVCEAHAARVRGQRGVQIETLPSFRSVGA